MSKGFCLIDREWTESEEWLSEPFDKVRAWIDIFTRASYTDTEIVKRGQLITSERVLAARWQWPRSRVTRTLEKWEKDGRITRTNNRTSNEAKYGTTITVENYEKYQSPRTTNRTTNRTSNRTYKNNINKLNNNLSLMSDEETDELLQSFSPEALTDLTMDVREYYENNPDKTFPGWIKAIKQFDRNQKRWGKATKKQSSTDRAFEAFKAEIEAEEKK